MSWRLGVRYVPSMHLLRPPNSMTLSLEIAPEFEGLIDHSLRNSDR